MTELLHGLAPIVGDHAGVLILGNMPSAMSLASQRYYGNPRNAFWRITGTIYGFAADAPYEDRTAALRANGVAVWDVLRSCRRAGSLDSAVERDSMVPNSFTCFFKQYPTIRQVVFNGAAAEANFGRMVDSAPPPRVRLPSTSPAQTMRFEDKLQAWRAGLNLCQ